MSKKVNSKKVISEKIKADKYKGKSSLKGKMLNQEKKNKKMKEKKGMGFKAAAVSISKKQGIPMKNASAILASKTRTASPAAKKANANLKKVK